MWSFWHLPSSEDHSGIHATYVTPARRGLPVGPEWIYELKLDRYRALAFNGGGRVQLRSRNDNDLNAHGLARLPTSKDDSRVLAS